MKLTDQYIYLVIYSNRSKIKVEPFSTEDAANDFINEQESSPDWDEDTESLELSIKKLREA